MDYFGARYYDSRLGFWMSVDPLADKYPNVTPYLYCNANPVMLVDPDGRFFTFSGDKSFVNRICDAIDYIKSISPELDASVTALENNPNINFNFACSTDAYEVGLISPLQMEGLTTGVLGDDNFTVYLPPTNDTNEENEKCFFVRNDLVTINAILAHEIGHCEDAANGKGVSAEVYNEAQKGPNKEAAKAKVNENERNAIKYENMVRRNEKCEERSYNYYD